MCGRFSLFADDDELVALFDIDLLLGENAPSWNVAPSQPIRVVVERVVGGAPASDQGQDPDRNQDRNRDRDRNTDKDRDGEAVPVQRQLRLFEWGLVPSWSKTPAHPIINARAETLTEKPSFRAAAARRRCLVPANGYFEWQTPESGGPKQPWFLSAGPGDPVIAFAGIYEAWRRPEAAERRGDTEHRADDWLLTCAIVTRSAPDALGEIHDRMPVVVPPRAFDSWLDPTLTERSQVDAMLHSMPAPDLVPRRVGRAVGNVRNDSPDLIAPIDRDRGTRSDR